MILLREQPGWSEWCFEWRSPLESWQMWGVTRSILFPSLLLGPPFSFASWAWSLLLFSPSSGRIMDHLYSPLMQSPALSPPTQATTSPLRWEEGQERHRGAASLVFQAIAEGLEKPQDPCRATDPRWSWPPPVMDALVQPQPIPIPREVPHARGWGCPHCPQMPCS